MASDPVFLLEDDNPPQVEQQEKQPWYKSLPQANMNLAGKLAARSVIPAIQLSPPALALDLLSIAGNALIQKGNALPGAKGKITTKIPSSEDVIKPIEHLAGLEENPQGAERIFKNISEYIQLAKGGGLKKKAAKALALAAGEEATGQLLGEEGRQAFKTVAPLAVKGGEPLVTGKQPGGESTLQVAVSKNPELKSMYDYGRSIGLTDKQLTPILQPDIKQRLFARFAKKTKGFKEQIDETKAAIGDNYRRLKAQGRAQVISPTQQYQLYTDLADMHHDISQTGVVGPDNQAILSTLEEAMDSLSKKPQTIESLINSHINVNQIPNWNAANDGKRRLGEVNKFYQRAISAKDPRVGEEFKLTNQMYKRQAEIRKATGLKKGYEDFLTAAEMVGLLSGVAYGAFTGDYKNAGIILGTVSARRLATQMLTNPRLQGVHRNIMKALTSGDQTALLNAMKQLDPILNKESPEEWQAAKAPTFRLED